MRENKHNTSASCVENHQCKNLKGRLELRRIYIDNKVNHDMALYDHKITQSCDKIIQGLVDLATWIYINM